MTTKFFIIAGEASGDVLGGKMIAEIKAQFREKNEQAEFVGVGGKMMQEQGFTSIFDMSELSIMGFFEVVPHIFKLLCRINQTAAEILKQEPDYVITIDSPDFNFRVLKKLKNYNKSKKIHLIAPSVWAYRKNRAKKIAKLYDLLLAILPFEPPYFKKYGLETAFVGHPIVEDVPDMSQKELARSVFRDKHGFYISDSVIYVTPGSRIGEVKYIFPEFIEAINVLKDRVTNLSVVISSVDKTKNLVEKMAKDLQVKYVVIEKDQKKEALFASDFALAKSGTNTFEALIYHLPMLVCYKVNSLTFFVAKFMFRVRFANLINLIMEREIIPELIQKNCNAQIIAGKMEKLIKNPDVAKKQIADSQTALRVLGLGAVKNPTKKIVQEILSL